MAHVFEGERSYDGGRFAVIVSRYNRSITSKLLEGALDAFASAGVADDHVDVAWVPGAWEIPLIAKRMASSGRYEAMVCLGAVIRGETSHDRHINRAVSMALARLPVTYDLPVLFGVLTCETLEQAIHRAGGSAGNKGRECAESALEMVQLVRLLPPSRPDGTMGQDLTKDP